MRGHLNAASVQGRNYAARLARTRERAETAAQKSKYSQEKSLMDLVAEAEEAKKRGAQVSTLEKQSRAAQERYESQLKKHENMI